MKRKMMEYDELKKEIEKNKLNQIFKKILFYYKFYRNSKILRFNKNNKRTKK